ncbi:terminase small subunit [Acinetobacter pollinis]|uniref:Terminase small subunit n=1 Tax=Acinetobacter pollinis TaxID=2605270 RepID=A0ABU6DQ49_9GAMM|nr:terminase small subunit [Acinetobacter pollinis]MEB5475970.1 terminase small subunit [Acinetobacter pollinis]
MTELKLTPKQEQFCQLYIELGNASEAYRQAYDADSMSENTVNRKAKEVLDNGKITARLEKIRKRHQSRHDVTVDTLLAELEEARRAAKGDGTRRPQANVMLSATMGKAKLLGLDRLSILQAKRYELEIEKIEAENNEDDDNTVQINIVRVGKDAN